MMVWSAFDGTGHTVRGAHSGWRWDQSRKLTG
jgi:hypothetical protein